VPDEKADISPTADPKLTVQLRRMDLQAGWLGRVVGSSKNAPNNMAFLILLLTFAAGFAFGIAYPSERLDFWKLILPVITLTIGYVFGRTSTA
jgi:hypothetical protein